MSWCASPILIFEPLVLMFEEEVIKAVVCQKYMQKRFADAISIFFVPRVVWFTCGNCCKYFEIWLQNLKSEFRSF